MFYSRLWFESASTLWSEFTLINRQAVYANNFLKGRPFHNLQVKTLKKWRSSMVSNFYDHEGFGILLWSNLGNSYFMMGIPIWTENIPWLSHSHFFLSAFSRLLSYIHDTSLPPPPPSLLSLFSSLSFFPFSSHFHAHSTRPVNRTVIR